MRPDFREARSRARLPGLLLLLPVLLLAPGPGATEPSGKRPEPAQARTAEDLLIVDCLLPSRVRRLGRRSTFMMPRQPLKTTAVECRIRGGEYTEPDQANLGTALVVWLPQAEAGDAEAQYYVGQMFERGLGVAPDYASAAKWYAKAAEQGYSAAQVSLGYLYEEGLGVEADGVAALNWYRKAAGLPAELVVLQEADYAELVRTRGELDEKLKEVDALRRETGELRRQLEAIHSEAQADQERRSLLESALSRLEGELDRQKTEVVKREDLIAALEQRLGAAQAGAEGRPAAATLPPREAEIDFGSYHALVIGNRVYSKLPALETAVNDAREIAGLLETKYGFEVELLIDSTRYQTMTALNRLRESLTPADNLVVYYAGHGARDEKGEVAYWQPVDAEPGNPANWIPSEVVTEHLDLVPAKHVLVVADSVYSGLRTRSSVANLPRGMTEEQRFHYIRLLLEKRSRLVLASGAARPVPEGGDASSSRFSRAFRQVLQDNDGVLEASKIYQQLTDRLVSTAGAGAPQVPEFATMRWARNNVSDFFFVPGS